MKPRESHPHAEKLWSEALEIVRRAPAVSLGLDFEEKIFLLFSLIEVEINSTTISVAYHSALSSEDLSWLHDRLAHELSKSA